MTRKKITGVLILLLLSVIFLQEVFPSIITILPKQDKIRNSQKTTENGQMKNNTSLSSRNNNLPKQKAEIIIDPGHGGIDSGVDKGHIVESEVTLDISKKLKTFLEEKSQ